MNKTRTNLGRTASRWAMAMLVFAFLQADVMAKPKAPPGESREGGAAKVQRPRIKVTGRYVRVEIPKRPAIGDAKSSFGRFIELQVYVGKENIARDCAVTSCDNSANAKSTAHRMVDGDFRDYMNSSLNLGGKVVNPWVELDLGREVLIDSVCIYIKGGNESAPWSYLVSVLDGKRALAWYRRVDLGGQRPNNIKFTAFAGRYLGKVLEPGTVSWYDFAGELPGEVAAEPVDLALPPSDRSAEDQRRFAERGSEAGLADLCRRLQAATDPNTKMMEGFTAKVQQGAWREALDVYRDTFFRRLLNPSEFGIRSIVDIGIGADYTETVDTIAVNYAMQNARVAKERNTLFVGRVGAPGQVRWVPRGREVEDAALTNEITFFAMPEHAYAPRGLMADELLKSYIATGNREHLAKWADFIDDWCMFGRAEFFASPYNLPNAGEPSPLSFVNQFTIWKKYLDSRPEFSREIRSSTLVRWLLANLEDAPPYLVRMRRTELANHAAGGTLDLAVITQMLPEFRASQWYARESLRLAMSSYIHHRSLDGENMEADDEGHRHSDRKMGDVLNLSPLLPLGGESWRADALSRQYFADLFIPVYRNWLVRFAPDGYDWPCWPANGSSLRKPSMDTESRRARLYHVCRTQYPTMEALGAQISPLPGMTDLWSREPEAMARLGTFMGFDPAIWIQVTATDNSWGTPSKQNQIKMAAARAATRPGTLPQPAAFSDPAPYSGVFYLRDRWEPGAEFFQLSAPPIHSRSQGVNERVIVAESGVHGFGSMRYDLCRDGRAMLLSEAIAVNRKIPNPWHDAVPTGGKTEYCITPVRQVNDTRFHTSAAFDLAEVRRAIPYSRPEKIDERGDWFNLWRRHPDIDNTPIFGITAVRQVYHLRDSGVWLIYDRLEDPSPEKREFCAFWSYPAWVKIEGAAAAIKSLAGTPNRLVEESQGKVRTTIPGAANITSHFFGPDFRMITRLDPDGTYVTENKNPRDLILERLAAGMPENEVMLLNSESAATLSMRQVGVRWEGTGNQVFIAVHATRPACPEPVTDSSGEIRDVRELKGEGGTSGVQAITADGKRLFFQGAPKRQAPLTAGVAFATGESLLLVEDGKTLSGLLLGSDGTITIKGRKYRAAVSDFEYRLTDDGTFTATPIYGMIDTVRISPPENVFTDRVAVTFDIPSQDTKGIEFRYTTDGSDPTLASSVAQGLVVLTRDTYLKVRPFRTAAFTGTAATTPWNIPGTTAGKTVGAVFRRQATRPALTAPALPATMTPGLAYDYFEAPWTTLMAHADVPGVLTPRSSGKASGLLVPGEVQSIRKTDQAYAIRYRGFITVPASGVYTFHAPEHLYTPTMDAGFDLRVRIDGEEWFPSPSLHSENAWSIPLAAGTHRLEVCFIDFRWKTFKNEMMMPWLEGEVWQGIPKLEISGSNIDKQPVPAAWLKRIEAK